MLLKHLLPVILGPVIRSWKDINEVVVVGRMFIGIIQRLQVLGYIYHNSESDEETH